MTYAELVTAIGAGTLNKGESITITDFQTTHYLCNGDGVILDPISSEPVINTGAVERIIVHALDSNTLAPDSHSLDYPDDIIGYDWNPDNWIQDIGFSTDQATIITNFKGVIYKRYDSNLENLVGYDFRTVKFRRWKKNYPIWSSTTIYNLSDKIQVAADGVYASITGNNLNNPVSDGNYWFKIIDYTYTEYFEPHDYNAQNVEDYIDCLTFHSIEEGGSYERNVKAVKFTPFKDTQDQFWGYIGSILSNNVFYLTNYGSYSFFDLEFGTFVELNTFIKEAEQCKIGTYFYSNTIGNYFNYNTIGNGFISNTIGNDFYSNTIGNDFQTNIIGNTFNFNTIGNYFYSNTIGNDFNSNTIGNGFKYNTIQNNIQYIITPDKTSGNEFRNNFIRDRVQGAYGTELDFTSATHVFLNYNCEIYSREDGTIKLKYTNNSDTIVVVNYNA